MTRSPADLMRRNLLEVFNEPDPARRAAVIAETYTEDVVWHEPDRIIRGRKELERRAEELRGENPDWVFRPAGSASELDDIGHLGFQYGPPDRPPMATGMDIARTRDGVIVELYTIVTELRQP
jgi:SnoaL-like domain